MISLFMAMAMSAVGQLPAERAVSDTPRPTQLSYRPLASDPSQDRPQDAVRLEPGDRKSVV